MKWEQQQQRQDQEEEKHLSKPFSLTQEDWREFSKQTHTEEFLCTFGVLSKGLGAVLLSLFIEFWKEREREMGPQKKLFGFEDICELPTIIAWST